MAFLTGSISLQVYTDTAQTNFPTQYALNETMTWTSSSVLSAQNTVVVLAGSGSQTINLNGLTSTVKRISVFSDTSNINVNINGLGNILFQSGEPSYMPATITSLVITNSSSSVATTVTVALIGS